jgi:hypothetical protein
MSSSSSPLTGESLLNIPIEVLHAHPANPNDMSSALFEKLKTNIDLEKRYPPLIVREHPEIEGEYQVLDGHFRKMALEQLGYTSVSCYPWPCDDRTALLLLATLNRLEGQDIPARRAVLLEELADLVEPDDLEKFIPENTQRVNEMISMMNLDVDSILSDLESRFETERQNSPRLTSFPIEVEDINDVDGAIDRASNLLIGKNRRGRALAMVCRGYLEVADA